jgi:hypothetical protein
MVYDHDLSMIDREIKVLQERAVKDFCLKAMKINNWNNDLSPWKAEAVFGREDFEGRGDETLEEVLRETEDQEPGGKDPKQDSFSCRGHGPTVQHSAAEAGSHMHAGMESGESFQRPGHKNGEGICLDFGSLILRCGLIEHLEAYRAKYMV